MFLETRIIDLHFAADGIDLSLFKLFWWAAKNFHFCKSDVSAIQGHLRSLNLAPIERTYATSY